MEVKSKNHLEKILYWYLTQKEFLTDEEADRYINQHLNSIYNQVKKQSINN